MKLCVMVVVVVWIVSSFSLRFKMKSEIIKGFQCCHQLHHKQICPRPPWYSTFSSYFSCHFFCLRIIYYLFCFVFVVCSFIWFDSILKKKDDWLQHMGCTLFFLPLCIWFAFNFSFTDFIFFAQMPSNKHKV